jgi:hypothetical protein
MGLSSTDVDAKVTELLGNLGLLPSQVETQIKITKDQEALHKIEIFSGALDDLPADVQSQIIALTEEGQPQEAWQLMQDAVAAKGAVIVDTEADTEAAKTQIEAIESGAYTAIVIADAETKQAEEDLAYLARNRRVQLTGEVVGGGKVYKAGGGTVYGPAGGYTNVVTSEYGAETLLVPNGTRVLTASETARDEGADVVNNYITTQYLSTSTARDVRRAERTARRRGYRP